MIRRPTASRCSRAGEQGAGCRRRPGASRTRGRFQPGGSVGGVPQPAPAVPPPDAPAACHLANSTPSHQPPTVHAAALPASTGGRFDGGDTTRFVFPQAWVVSVLALSHRAFGAGYAASGQQQRLFDQLRWSADFLAACRYEPGSLVAYTSMPGRLGVWVATAGAHGTCGRRPHGVRQAVCPNPALAPSCPAAPLQATSQNVTSGGDGQRTSKSPPGWAHYAKGSKAPTCWLPWPPPLPPRRRRSGGTPRLPCCSATWPLQRACTGRRCSLRATTRSRCRSCRWAALAGGALHRLGCPVWQRGQRLLADFAGACAGAQAPELPLRPLPLAAVLQLHLLS